MYIFGLCYSWGIMFIYYVFDFYSWWMYTKVTVKKKSFLFLSEKAC
jgi:hypothetical protein